MLISLTMLMSPGWFAAERRRREERKELGFHDVFSRLVRRLLGSFTTHQGALTREFHHEVIFFRPEEPASMSTESKKKTATNREVRDRIQAETLGRLLPLLDHPVLALSGRHLCPSAGVTLS